MFELAKKYNDSISLTLGEPGFTAPDHIIEAGIKGLRDAFASIVLLLLKDWRIMF